MSKKPVSVNKAGMGRMLFIFIFCKLSPITKQPI